MAKTEVKLAEVLEESLAAVLPWSHVREADLESALSNEPAHLLGMLHLFRATCVAIPVDEAEPTRFINARFRNVLSAAYHAQLSVATIIVGKGGTVNVYFGFAPAVDDAGASREHSQVFQRILEGVFPGSEMEYVRGQSLLDLVEGYEYGGIISGIPTLKIEDEHQEFNIASVVRSMYGESYVVAVMAKPVPTGKLGHEYEQLLEFRDQCHSAARQNVSDEAGGGENYQEQHSKSTREGKSDSVNLLIYSKSWSSDETTTAGHAQGIEKHWSHSISREQQNGVAMELERLSEQLVTRMYKGLNVGYWETTVSFACKTDTGRRILGGSFLGELSKPSPDGLPPRMVLAPTSASRPLLIPVEDRSSSVFPCSLCSYMTSEELSMVASPPHESLPGFDAQRVPALSLTDVASAPKDGTVTLGSVTDKGAVVPGSCFTLSNRDLNKHVFVCGITGSGKTTTVKQILKGAGLPFLVLESAKRDYRQLLADEAFKNDLRIYTIGDATISPIKLNPFYLLPGVLPLTHIDHLKAIFNASFSLYGPMPYILEHCLHTVYVKKGWNLTGGVHPHFLDPKGRVDGSKYLEPEHYYTFPTLDELQAEVESYVRDTLGYRGELSDNIRTAIVARLESLSVGAKGLMFNTHDFVDVNELLQHPVVFEMEALSDDDDKAFFVGIILSLISEHRQRENPSINPLAEKPGLKHLLVIEEAHRLLKNVHTERTSEMMGNPRGKAVDTFCNMISEMRSLGEGIIVAEQIPSKIAPDVIKNTNTKLVQRLVGRDDQSLLAGSLSMSEDDALYLSRLTTGHALCHKEGMEQPVEIKILPDFREVPIANEKVFRVMRERDSSVVASDARVQELKKGLGPGGEWLSLRLVNSLLLDPPITGTDLVDKACKEIRKLCLVSETHISYHEESAKGYLRNRVLFTMSRGAYSRDYVMPKGLYSILTQVLTSDQSKENAIKDFQKLMSVYWKTEAVGEVIVDIVSNLAVLAYCKLKKSNQPVNLRKLAASYFLIEHPAALDMIVQRVQGKMEVA
jgi:hypothetical protein